MTSLRLILKNGLRNKRRTIFTMISVALALFVLSTLVGFVTEIEGILDEASPTRVITRHAVSLANVLPERYGSPIAGIPGVAASCSLSWFGGTYIDAANTDFAQFSCDPESFFDVYNEIRIPEDQKAAFIRERAACVVGRGKAEKHGWKIGDRITLKGVIWPVDLELTIRGIYSGTSNQEAAVYFHRLYLEEAMDRPGVVGSYWIRCATADDVPKVIAAVDGMFRNTDAPTKTETEKAFNMSFISMLGNLRGLVATLSGVIIFTLLLVSGNTMAMSVRERIREIAVLRALGFRSRRVMAMLVLEGVVITLAGGLLGGLGAKFLFASLDLASYSQGFFQKLTIPWTVIGLGAAIAALVGLASAGLPAWFASKKTVVEGLRHVG
jgi:putative ABC transport system permease protein